ncbi:MAG: substrate-binding domain-containing protein [Treponema sp.]|jgi:phosphate transport system substrate-binding protein|nr:substrate-binding domain-containing protein [Treponema sp.]
MQMKKMGVKTIIVGTITVLSGLGITVLFFYFLINFLHLPISSNRETQTQRGLQEISRREIDLTYYRPFRENNRLAKLDGKSEFKIIDNLPILDGATSFYPVYAAFVETVYSPEHVYWTTGMLGISTSVLKLSRTADSYNNLLEGKADIIFCLEPSQVQLQRIYESNINIKFVPIGKEAFVFFVNRKNPLNNLNIEDIQGIYSGRITNWKGLNRKNRSITVYQRPGDSGSQTILEKIMGDIPIVRPVTERVSPTMGSLVSHVATYQPYTDFNNAIGYSFLIYSTEMIKNNQIKLLSINGIYPSAETIQNNSYPFTVDFYAIYNDTEKKNENIEPFIEWILSEQGQTLVSRTGYVPIAGYIK